MIVKFIRKRYLGLLCAFIATMCWACNYPVSRLLFKGSGVDDLDPWWTAWLRVFFGAVIFLVLSFFVSGDSWRKFRGSWKIDGKMFVFLAACSVAESVLCFIALKYTTSARASLLANTSPVFTLLISVIAGKEFLSRRKITGVLLGLSGIIIAAVSRGGDMFSGGVSTLAGDLLAVTSGIFWALFTVYGGTVSSRYQGVFCTALYRLGGILLMLPVLIVFDSRISFDMPFVVWAVLIYLSVISGGFATWLWSIAQRHVEPGSLGLFGYLSAFCATAFSLCFLGEKITAGLVLSFCCIIGGMMLVIGGRR